MNPERAVRAEILREAHARYHAWFHHNNADGWIAVAKKEKNGIFRQYHYKPEDLAKELTSWLGEDVYFSQNTFYKPARAIENIRQLRALYIDVDFYMFNLDLEWVMGNIGLLVEDSKIPEPNMVIHSGQGLVCIWLIEPVPYRALPLWQAVQNHFFKLLEQFGADAKAIDAARIFRVAGSTHSETGREVTIQYRHEYRYVLKDIQYEYLPALTPSRTKKRGRPGRIVRLHNIYSLHHSRLLDIVKLVELRNYDVYGYREVICFLYRYWKCCFIQDEEQALEETLAFNSQFLEPLADREVIICTKSAEKAAKARNDEEANRIAREKGFPAAGYNLKNVTLIDWLDITAKEQQHLLTIIDANEKRRRKRIANEKMRREKGMRKREDYLEEKKKKSGNKKQKLEKLIQDNPYLSNYKLSKLLGVSESYIRKLKKQMSAH